MSVKALLRRVGKLEPKPSAILQKFGGPRGLEKFESEMQAGIDAGIYCERDMPIVVRVIRRWASM